GTLPFALIATASSGLAVRFTSNTAAVCAVSGNTVTLVAVGTCSITASQAGNLRFRPATSVTQTFAVTAGAQTQTITFGPLSDATLGGAPFTLTATSTSGLAISFTSDTTPVCTVSGLTV